MVAVALGLVLEAINAFTLAIYPAFPLKTCTSPVIIRAQRLVLVAATYRLRELVRLALILLTAAPLGARAGFGGDYGRVRSLPLFLRSVCVRRNLRVLIWPRLLRGDELALLLRLIIRRLKQRVVRPHILQIIVILSLSFLLAVLTPSLLATLAAPSTLPHLLVL